MMGARMQNGEMFLPVKAAAAIAEKQTDRDAELPIGIDIITVAAWSHIGKSFHKLSANIQSYGSFVAYASG